MNRKASRFLAYPYMIWMAGFTVIPLLMVFYYGLTDRSGAFTLANILAIGSSEHLKALWLSLALAGVSTVICLLLAYPLALILRKRHIGKGSFVVFIFILPMWMNFLLRTMAWQTLLEKNGVINTFLTMLHLPNIAIINTPAAILHIVSDGYHRLGGPRVLIEVREQPAHRIADGDDGYDRTDSDDNAQHGQE